jgi:hypothetical protein
MGQKKRDRTTAWRNKQLAIEWKRRTEQAIAEIKAKKEAVEVEKKENAGEEKNEKED